MEDHAESLTEIRPLAELIGNDVANPEHHLGRGRQPGIGRDEISGPAVEVSSGRIGPKDLPGQRLQLPLPGDLGQGEFSGFECEVKVFELLEALG